MGVKFTTVIVGKNKSFLFIKLVFTTLLFTGIIFSSAAQDFKDRYKAAKDLYAKADYPRAMSAFQALITYDSQNPYYQYASYYYGLSSYKAGFLTVAKDILLQTKKLYPGWDRIDDVNYLLAQIYFDEHQYFRALAILKTIKNGAISKEAETMKRFYLTPIGDSETLKMVLEENPQDKEAARALVIALGNLPIGKREDRAIDSLVKKFHFVKEELVSILPLVSTKKDRYTVSLLFPFLASSLDPSAGIKRNQFVLDLYKGIRLAADTLRREGIFVDLLIYDTERNPESLKKLLESGELATTDIIVGPLFNEESKLVLPFSEKNRINVINPVSSNSDFLGKNPYAMLFQPSHETIGSAAAVMAASHARNKKCIVYYDESPKDSVMAFHFIQKATELGLKIIHTEEVRKETSASILTTLATATEHDDYKNPTQFTLRKDSLGCIFVASENPVIYSKVLNAAETRGDSILLIGNEAWISSENNTVDYSIFDRVGAVMASPNFSSVSNPQYIAFRKNYTARHGVLPSEYAQTGFEFMMFLGRSLHQYGVYFQEGLAKSVDNKGTIGEGYSFPGTRDNQNVPFTRFYDGKLKVINKR